MRPFVLLTALLFWSCNQNNIPERTLEILPHVEYTLDTNENPFKIGKIGSYNYSNYSKFADLYEFIIPANSNVVASENNTLYFGVPLNFDSTKSLKKSFNKIQINGSTCWIDLKKDTLDKYSITKAFWKQNNSTLFLLLFSKKGHKNNIRQFLEKVHYLE